MMKNLLYVGCAAAMLAFAGTPSASLADTAPSSSDARPDRQAMHEQWRANRQAILDARLVGFKASLVLTPEQEKNWAPFENALRSLVGSAGGGDWRGDHKADGDAPPSPVDAMRNIAARISKRAALLTALADSSEPLYSGLDDKQKLVFRATLKQMWRARRSRWEHRERD
jgi:LTXXQ motif family protein